MENLSPTFAFHGQSVRTAGTPDAPLFVAADVCRVLEIGTEQIRRLDDDEKGLRSIQTPGGVQEMAVVNEAGLYALILGSRKPQAREFKRWVTHEVLPAIRRTGHYEVPAADLSDPLVAARLLQDTTARFIASETARREALHQLEIQAPAVAFAQKVELSPVDINIGTFAKMIGWGPNLLHAELRRRGFFFKRGGHPVPKQCHVDAGYFRLDAHTGFRLSAALGRELGPEAPGTATGAQPASHRLGTVAACTGRLPTCHADGLCRADPAADGERGVYLHRAVGLEPGVCAAVH